MAELEARGLVVDRTATGGGNPVRALHGVDVAVHAGELVVVMGATGSGKTSLALALAGLLAPAAGVVQGAASGAVRMVLQRPEASFLESRVLDEVSLAARHRGEPRASAEQRARELLAELALPADVADRDPLALSGGEQRRVAIAAVLAADPRLTILDEPSAGLDAAARAELHATLRRLHAGGRTLLVVTHDPAEAAELASRLVVLAGGRIVWDGATTTILGDPQRAEALGLDVAPEVRILHAVAAGRGVALARTPARPADAIRELADVVAARPPDAHRDRHPAPAPAGPRPSPPATGGSLPALPALVDARARLLACGLAIAAALLARSLLAATLVVVAAAAIVATARIDRARVRLAVRPLLALAVLLVALQLLVGGSAETHLVGEVTTRSPALAALLRALQAGGVVLATLALSGATATADLSAAIRSALRPLGWIRVPVDALSFVVATGLGLVPALADELERLRLAQRARGIRSSSRSPVARLRDDAALLAPLFVAAFRRAHLLADALAVRGFDPARPLRPWRPRTTPTADLLLVLGGAALVGVSRLA